MFHTDSEIERIRNQVAEDVATLRRAESILGYGCFSEDAANRTKAINILHEIIDVCFCVEEANRLIEINNETIKQFIKKYIKHQLSK